MSDDRFRFLPIYPADPGSHNCSIQHTVEGECLACGKVSARDTKPLSDNFIDYMASPNNIRYPNPTPSLTRMSWITEKLKKEGVVLIAGKKTEGELLVPEVEPDLDNPSYATMRDQKIGTREEQYRVYIKELEQEVSGLRDEYTELHYEFERYKVSRGDLQ